MSRIGTNNSDNNCNMTDNTNNETSFVNDSLIWVPFFRKVDCGVIFIDTQKHEPLEIYFGFCIDMNILTVICAKVFVIFFVTRETFFKIVLNMEALNNHEGNRSSADVMLLP